MLLGVQRPHLGWGVQRCQTIGHQRDQDLWAWKNEVTATDDGHFFYHEWRWTRSAQSSKPESRLERPREAAWDEDKQSRHREPNRSNNRNEQTRPTYYCTLERNFKDQLDQGKWYQAGTREPFTWAHHSGTCLIVMGPPFRRQKASRRRTSPALLWVRIYHRTI